MNKLTLLKHLINQLASSYCLHSRVHALKTFNTTQANCYVKREDELGFGISGSKIRKYASLIPYLIKNNYQAAIAIGGAHSNHVAGITQLLIENNIKPILFLLGEATTKYQGNALLTHLLVPLEQIHWVARSKWPQIELMAAEYANQQPYPVKVITAGASMLEALPGLLSLPLDILQNEQQLQLEFQHVFIDAGTGLTAIAVILVFAWLNKKILVHVVLLSDKEDIFIKKLQQFQLLFEQIIHDKVDWEILCKQFKLYLPTQAASFGSVNTTVFKTIKTIARQEGFFTDPIYSAKLFFEARQIIANNIITGNTLIIHSGGGLTLMGFTEQLSKIF